MKKVFFLLLFTFALCLPVSQAKSIRIIEQPVAADGVLGIKWRQAKETMPTLEEREYDRPGKLFIYTLPGDKKSLYNIELSGCTYLFWDGKFGAVRAYFNGEKNADAFQTLYNKFVANFGLPKKQYTAANQAERQEWTVGDTQIRMDYFRADKAGALYFHSIALAKEMTESKKTSPKQPPSYPNQPDGFRNLAWGMTMPQMQQDSLKLNADTSGNYIIENDSKDFFGLTLDKLSYNFWREQLFSVYAYCKKQDAAKLYDQLVKQYGLPAQKRMQNGSQEYYWDGKKTTIIFYYDENLLFFTSTAIYMEKRTADNKGE